MKLTGKCKEDFEKWVYIKYELNNILELRKFNDYPESMQYGVYVDFFDSVGIYMSINPIENDAYERMYQVYEDENHIISCETRQEARTAAIEKENEIHNSKG